MGSKKFAKLGPRDVFERWSRGLKTELNTIPLCGKRFELGPLVNPRAEPSADDPIFRDEDGLFDGVSYEKALMLYELVEGLAKKVSNYLYATLTFCMSDNEPAQEVIMSTKEIILFCMEG